MGIIKEILYRFRGEYTTEKLISMGMTVGSNFKRLHGVILDPGHCWLITIGDNVTMAPRVHILCHDASTKQFLNYTKIGRVTIGDNVFIGAESVVLPGVTIGSNVIIGANSTVTHDIPENSVAVGSPARVICSHRQMISLSFFQIPLRSGSKFRFFSTCRKAAAFSARYSPSSLAQVRPGVLMPIRL